MEGDSLHSSTALSLTSAGPLPPSPSKSRSSSGASGTGKERPHPPPLDTAAANNLPRHELNSSLPPDSITPTPPGGLPSSSSSNANNDNGTRRPGHGTNAAGPSSPLPHSTFQIGVAEDVNRKCRRTMEDTHAFLYDFHKPGMDSGYFAIFDGHAGKSAAEFCGEEFHHLFSRQLDLGGKEGLGVPEILDRTFVECDRELDRRSCSSGANGNGGGGGGQRTSGCTAVVAYTRWEDRNVPDRNAIKKEHRKSGESNEAGGEQARPTKVERRRVLYTANVGDARIVLWFDCYNMFLLIIP